MSLSIGFIGTGHISKSVVTGLCTSMMPPERVVVSPRNAETAAALAARHPTVSVANNNQGVADQTDWVVLAVRPQIAREVLSALKFRADQKVISLIAPIADDWIGDAVRPGKLVARAMPLPPVETHLGPIAYFPANAEVEALLGLIGTPMAVADKRAMLVFWSLTALMASYYGFMANAADWARAKGVSASAANAYASAMLHALGAVAAKSGAKSPADLAKAAQTPGGLNEQVLGELTRGGWFDQVNSALDGILRRLEG
jgi:pyrroline-5-carboxylate reductase